MCGRFVLFATDDLLDHMGALPGVEEAHAPRNLPPARYNIAPTQVIPIVRLKEGLAQLDPARWGLLPHWKKDLDGPPLFNARAETVAKKPSFRDAFKAAHNSGRCLIPMDGYYEWKPEDGGKQPYFVTLGEGKTMWAAGLWATGMDQLSATIVTTAAAEPMDWLHDRLPRFLAPEEMRQWTDGSPEEAAELLHPAPAELRESFHLYAVDKAVGTTRNDYRELLGDLTDRGNAPRNLQ